MIVNVLNEYDGSLIYGTSDETMFIPRVGEYLRYEGETYRVNSVTHVVDPTGRGGALSFAVEIHVAPRKI